MPKINAPTVAEHRTAQRAALLSAARDLLIENSDSFGIGKVAERAGLARSSVYSYFSNAEDLVDALVVEVFPRWTEFVVDRMAAAQGPDAKISAYVDANLELVARGDHSLMRALANLLNPAKHTESAKLLHDELQAELHSALRDRHASAPALQSDLIQSVVFRASRELEDGADLALVRAAVHEVLGGFTPPSSSTATTSTRLP